MKKDLSLITSFGIALIILMSLIAGCKNEKAPPAQLEPAAQGEPTDQSEPTAIAITKTSAVTGHFVMYGFGLGGQNLKGTVDVKELADGSFSVEWIMHDEERYHGKGKLTEDGKLFIVYGGSEDGDGTWELMSNNDLHGKWHPKGSENYGIEVWSREPKSK